MRASNDLITIFLVGACVSAPALATPPDFTVESATSTFRLTDARGRFVALHFLLKTDCPTCQQHAAETVRRAPEVAGVVHLFLKPDSEVEVRKWTEELAASGVDALIYRDADARLANEFEIPDGYQFHGQSVHYPAVVLLGPDGKEVFRYVGKNNTDRLPFDRLAKQVNARSGSAALKEYNLGDDKLALKGYDPVAYFDSSKPAEGKAEWSSEYRGVTYRFATQEHRDTFAADPDKYVPAYGGWCATAMADGRRVDIDPTNFKVTDGRLFVFYKGWRGNALTDWNKEERGLTVRADAQWRKIAPTDSPERN